MHCLTNKMGNMKNIENLNPEKMARYLLGEATVREKLEMETWLDQSDENREELRQTQKMLGKVDTYFRSQRFDTHSAWEKVHAQVSPSHGRTVQLKDRRKEAWAHLYKYAAVLVVAILLGAVGYYIGFRNQVPVYYSEVISENKQVLNEYVLPDGSVVTLNSNSKLTFPRKFKGDIREVTIEGEAFFDVKPNPEKPFVIHAGDAQVKVLGTSFTVCAYPEGETVEVIVKTGKVQVTNNQENQLAEVREVYLTPGEKGTLFKQTSVLEKSANTDPNFLSWKTHDLVFDNASLGDVIQTLEKAYHVEIDLSEPELNDLHYEGHFDQKPADFVLDVIRLTFDLELTGDAEHYTLSSRKTTSKTQSHEKNS